MTEQEVIYVSFRDPDTLLPVLKFFNIATPELSQDAVGLKEAIKNAFKEKIWNQFCIKWFFFQLLVHLLTVAKNQD